MAFADHPAFPWVVITVAMGSTAFILWCIYLYLYRNADSEKKQRQKALAKHKRSARRHARISDQQSTGPVSQTDGLISQTGRPVSQTGRPTSQQFVTNSPSTLNINPMLQQFYGRNEISAPVNSAYVSQRFHERNETNIPVTIATSPNSQRFYVRNQTYTPGTVTVTSSSPILQRFDGLNRISSSVPVTSSVVTQQFYTRNKTASPSSMDKPTSQQVYVRNQLKLQKPVAQLDLLPEGFQNVAADKEAGVANVAYSEDDSDSYSIINMPDDTTGDHENSIGHRAISNNNPNSPVYHKSYQKSSTYHDNAAFEDGDVTLHHDHNNADYHSTPYHNATYWDNSMEYCDKVEYRDVSHMNDVIDHPYNTEYQDNSRKNNHKGYHSSAAGHLNTSSQDNGLEYHSNVVTHHADVYSKPFDNVEHQSASSRNRYVKHHFKADSQRAFRHKNDVEYQVHADSHSTTTSNQSKDYGDPTSITNNTISHDNNQTSSVNTTCARETVKDSQVQAPSKGNKMNTAGSNMASGGRNTTSLRNNTFHGYSTDLQGSNADFRSNIGPRRNYQTNANYLRTNMNPPRKDTKYQGNNTDSPRSYHTNSLGLWDKNNFQDSVTGSSAANSVARINRQLHRNNDTGRNNFQLNYQMDTKHSDGNYHASGKDAHRFYLPDRQDARGVVASSHTAHSQAQHTYYDTTGYQDKDDDQVTVV